MKRYLLAATLSTLSAFAADLSKVERPEIIFHENNVRLYAQKFLKTL